MSSSTIDEYTYNQDHNILICHAHDAAIPPDRVQRHLHLFHKAILIETRNKIIQYPESLPLSKPEAVMTPSSETRPIPDLELITDGYMCQFNGCLHCITTPVAMRKHCRIKHERKKWNEETWQSQAVQTFFAGQYCKYVYPLSNADSRYFPVTVESDPDPILIQNVITSLLDSAKTDDDNHQQELNNVPKNSELVTLTPSYSLAQDFRR